jgi:hypothetical protein
LQGRKQDLDRLETERVMNALFQDRIDQLFQAVQENAARVSDQIAVLTQTVENCHDETHGGFEMVERQLSDHELESIKYMEAAEEQGWLAERDRKGLPLSANERAIQVQDHYAAAAQVGLRGAIRS